MTYWQKRAQVISFVVGNIMCMRSNRTDEWDLRLFAARAEYARSGPQAESQVTAQIADDISNALIDAPATLEKLGGK